MKLKNHKRIILALMSLMLATTGCSSRDEKEKNTDNYQNSCYDSVSSLLNTCDFYNEDYMYPQDEYSSFYQKYLDNFIQYMTEEQCDIFLNLVKNMNQDERYEYKESLNSLNSMFNITESSYGRGFFKIFNTQVIVENLYFTGQVGGDISNDVNIIIALVNNDDELFRSIFSGDINKVIDCIASSTEFSNREVIEELILKMDLYTDLIASNDYVDELVKASYEDRIHEIIKMIIRSKCEKDSNFSASLFMTLLKESIYYDNDKITIHPGITTNLFEVNIKDAQEKYSIDKIDKSYLYEQYSKEKLRTLGVNNILIRSFYLENEEYHSVEDTVQLLMCLLDSDIKFDDIKSVDDFRKILYHHLRPYFSSSDEFNTFVLKLYSKCPNTLEEYFNIFIQSIEANGITLDDFVRYSALMNYNDKRKYVSINYADYENNYVAKEDLVNMSEEEYKDIASSHEENYFLGYIDYQKYFAKIEEILTINDLEFAMIENKNCTYEWKYGQRELVGEYKPRLISAEVLPETIEYQGTYIIFYEYPEFYEDGQAVEVFKNIKKETITREVEGFKAEIIDSLTGNLRTIYVVDMGPSKDGYDAIHFVIDAKSFAKFHENNQEINQILKGDNYE